MRLDGRCHNPHPCMTSLQDRRTLLHGGRRGSVTNSPNGPIITESGHGLRAAVTTGLEAEVDVDLTSGGPTAAIRLVLGGDRPCRTSRLNYATGCRPKQLTDILTQYYELIVQRMRDMGLDIDPAAPESALAEFWANSEGYLPPSGCLVVARSGAGDIIGCGMLKRLDQDTGELKRVFVVERARGTGTGRALIEAREAAARQMGLKRLVADTVTPNVEMRRLYPRLGFVELDGPIETTTYRDQPMLRPHMHFFSKDL